MSRLTRSAFPNVMVRDSAEHGHLGPKTEFTERELGNAPPVDPKDIVKPLAEIKPPRPWRGGRPNFNGPKPPRARDMRTVPSKIQNACIHCNSDHDPAIECRQGPRNPRQEMHNTVKPIPVSGVVQKATRKVGDVNRGGAKDADAGLEYRGWVLTVERWGVRADKPGAGFKSVRAGNMEQVKKLIDAAEKFGGARDEQTRGEYAAGNWTAKLLPIVKERLRKASKEVAGKYYDARVERKYEEMLIQAEKAVAGLRAANGEREFNSHADTLRFMERGLR